MQKENASHFTIFFKKLGKTTIQKPKIKNQKSKTKMKNKN
jgi:hypothetical protein